MSLNARAGLGSLEKFVKRKPVRSVILPEDDSASDSAIAQSEAVHLQTAVAQALVVASVALVIWAVVLGLLVIFNAIQLIPALVLGVLGLIVLAVELARARPADQSRNRFGPVPVGTIAPGDLQNLLEVERANFGEERRALLARELSRLAREALQLEPSARSTWPNPEGIAALRNQIALLRSSSSDPSARRLPVGSPVGQLTNADLAEATQALDVYVAHLSRLQRLNVDDDEQTRILLREQNRLRAMQDMIVGQLQQPTIPPPLE